MTTWNDLIITNPPDTELVSNGAFRIRQVVDAGKTTTALEHYETGEHKFPVAQPGAAQTNQIWFDLVNKIIRRFDGTDQTILNTVSVYSASGSFVALATAGAETVVATVAGVVVPVNGRVLAAFVADPALNSGTFPNFAIFRMRRNGATQVGPTVTETIRGDETIINGAKNLVGFGVDIPSAGTYNYTLVGSQINGVQVNAGGNSILVVLVL